MKISKLTASATLLSIGLSFGDAVIAGEKQKPPFVGTRWFNFMGGKANENIITIERNGNTKIESYNGYYRKIDAPPIYKGKFSNPIVVKNEGGILGDTHRYLFKSNKVYAVSVDGEIIKGCRGEDKICESDLYNPSTNN